MRPLVSILIPCYNAEGWIESCVESALAQTYPDTEVLVLDDGSSDASWERLQKYAGQVKLISQSNKGGNPTRNRLLRESKGDWLQYLDADDWLGPDKIARQVESLENAPVDTDVLYGEVQVVEMEGDEPGKAVPTVIRGTDPWEQLVTWQLPQTGAPLWKKEAVVAVGGWKPDQPCCQEHDLYLRLLKSDRGFFYSGVTDAFYRQWSDQTVCKSNVPLVHEKRMEIVMEARHHLMESGAYTDPRKDAVCQAAFETARGAFQYDRSKARDLYRFIRRENPAFVPVGDAAPPSFRQMSKFLGYMGAEYLASFRRSI
jgi:glycosyltransferase involved in cell wall biosynthesis